MHFQLLNQIQKNHDLDQVTKDMLTFNGKYIDPSFTPQKERFLEIRSMFNTCLQNNIDQHQQLEEFVK